MRETGSQNTASPSGSLRGEKELLGVVEIIKK